MKNSSSRQDGCFFNIDESDVEQELSPNVTDELSELSESSAANSGIKYLYELNNLKYYLNLILLLI